MIGNVGEWWSVVGGGGGVVVIDRWIWCSHTPARRKAMMARRNAKKSV